MPASDDDAEPSADRPRTTRRAPARGSPAGSASATLAGVAWLVAFGLVFSPEDVVQARASACSTSTCRRRGWPTSRFIVTAAASVLYLFWKRTRSAGTASRAPGPRSVCCSWASRSSAASMWGRLTWGEYWVWDARLDVHGVPVRHVRRLPRRARPRWHARPARQAQRGRRHARRARDPARPLQRRSCGAPCTRTPRSLQPEGDVKMNGLMLFTLFVGIIAFSLMYLWLLLHRQRILAMRGHDRRRAVSSWRSPTAEREPANRRTRRRRSDGRRRVHHRLLRRDARRCRGLRAGVIRRGKKLARALPDEDKPWLDDAAR